MENKLKTNATAIAAVTLLGLSAQAHAEDDLSVRISPLPLIIGGIYLEAPYKLNDQIAAGPFAAYINSNILGNKTKMFQGGVRADYYAEGTFKEGWMASVAAGYASGDMTIVDQNDKSFSGSGSGASFLLAGGYNWRWDKVTLNLEMGYSVSTQGSLTLKSSDGEKKSQPLSGPAFDLSVGWLF